MNGQIMVFKFHAKTLQFVFDDFKMENAVFEELGIDEGGQTWVLR